MPKRIYLIDHSHIDLSWLWTRDVDPQGRQDAGHIKLLGGIVLHVGLHGQLLP